MPSLSASVNQHGGGRADIGGLPDVAVEVHHELLDHVRDHVEVALRAQCSVCRSSNVKGFPSPPKRRTAAGLGPGTAFQQRGWRGGRGGGVDEFCPLVEWQHTMLTSALRLCAACGLSVDGHT